MSPAVTWGLLITDRISIKRCLVYVGSQLLGGVIGASILYGLLPEQLRFGLGCHRVNDELTGLQGVGCEIIFTFIFILVVFSTAISPFVGKHAPLSGDNYGPGKLTPFAIGMTIMVLHCIGIPLTGASMNPARSFGPALVRGCWDNHWVYWIGLITVLVAALLTKLYVPESPVKTPSKIDWTGAALLSGGLVAILVAAWWVGRNADTIAADAFGAAPWPAFAGSSETADG